MSEVKKDDKNSWKVILLQRDPPTIKYEEALVQARKHYMEIYNDGSFLKLERERLREILNSDELNVENEQVVFESVKRWLEYNFEYYGEHIKPLLRVVRFSELPLKYLFDEVKPFVFPFEDCRDTFMNFIRDYILGENKVKAATRKYQKQFTTISNSKTAESDRRLLSIGSDRSNTANVVEIYDGSLDQWIKPNELDINRINFSIELIDNKVMLIGGTRSLDESTEPLKTVQSLELSSGILSPEDSLNDARQNSAAVVFGDGKLALLYVLGGRGKDKDLDSVERWDPLIREWHRVQPMPNKRVGLAAAVLNSKIYALGGKIDDNYTNMMDAYDLKTAEWEKKASMKEARAHFCVAPFKNCLYAVAGIKENQSHLIAAEKYDPFYNSWVTIANIPSTGHVGISSLGNRLICAGGKNSYVFEYNDKIDQWFNLKDLHKPRAGYLVQLPKAMNNFKFNWPKHKNDYQKMPSNRFLMLGNLKSNTVASLEEYNAEKNQWTRLKDLDIGKIYYSVAIVDENLLMIGGYLSNGLHSNEVDSLNLHTGKHSQLAPLNYRRQNSATAVVRQEKLAFIYAIGGMKDEQLLNLVERWDSSIRTWTMVTPMSVARAGHGAVLLKNRIYVVGGKTGKETYDKTVEAYDYENDRWTPKASMNNPNAYFGITIFKNHIYVAGGNRDAATPVSTVERYDPLKDTWTTIANISSTGMVGISGTSDRLICSGGKSSNLVEEYDESKNTWRELKPLDTQGSGFLVDLSKDIEIYSGDWIFQRRPSNRLIFLGGGSYEIAKGVETFDTVEKTWTKLKDLTFIIRQFCPIIISNKLLLIGGNEEVEKIHIVDSIRAIDLSSGAFQSFPPLKHARCLTSSVIVTDGKNTSLYVLGGYNRVSISSVEKWDPSTNEWTEEIPMTFPRHGHSCVFLHGKIYAVGGGDKGKALDTVEAFHVKNKRWETKTSMKHKRYYFGITLYNDQIYVAGGGGLSIVERYDPPTDTWTTLASIQSNGQVALCTLGDRMICAGGWKNTVEEYNFNENKWVSLPSKNKIVARNTYLLELPENAKVGNW